jgi:hypothetical protein
VWQRVNLFPGDEPAPHCLVDSLPDEILVYMASLEQIQNRAQWACNSHSLHLFDIAFAEIGSVKNQNFRNSAVASKMFGDCYVQLRGQDIGEFVKTESRVVTVCAFRNFLTILRPQIPKRQIRALRRGKIGQPINTTMLPDPVSDFHVVGMGLFAEPCSRGLLGGEEPLLRLRYFVEPSCGFFGWSRHGTIPLLSWGIMRHARAPSNRQSCRANLMRTQEIHYLAPLLSRTAHDPS